MAKNSLGLTCEVDKCENLATSNTSGMCEKHRARLRRTGTLDLLPRVSKKTDFGSCSFYNCGNKSEGKRGLCSHHRREVDVSNFVYGKCSVLTCTLPSYFKDKPACRTHRHRSITYQIPLERLYELDEITKCQICETELFTGWGTQYDHCHQTGKFRGVICNACNNHLSFLDLPEEYRTKLIAYHKNPPG